METYDVVIIGAGPAGLNCADKLAEKGKSILLLEQNELVGPKVCAGGLTSKSFNYLNLPEGLIDYKYKKIIFHTPFNKTIVKSDDFFVFTIDRGKLGRWQLDRVKKKGAEVRLKSRVTGIEKGFVVVNNSEKIGYQDLVGADGSLSRVRKYLGLKTENPGVAVQYILKTEKYRELEIFCDSGFFHSWYAWIFPHRGYVSVGCGCDPAVLPVKKLRENFEKWLRKNKIDTGGAEYQAHYINSDFRGYRFGNIFLAGDAAGLTSGLTGEGIYQALLSGEEAAGMIAEKRERSEKMDALLSAKKTHEKVLRILKGAGAFRKIHIELIALLLKNRFISKKALKILCG